MKMEDQIKHGVQREKREAERPPFAGLREIGRTRGGAPIWGPARREPAGLVRQSRPLWKYVGDSPTIVPGIDGLVRPGAKFYSDSWQRPEEDIEPHNDTAREIAAYFSEHRRDPRLPALAWDDDAAEICTIPPETSPSVKVEPEPNSRTRDPDRPSAHVEAPRKKLAGES
jgi:hypothetical protein